MAVLRERRLFRPYIYAPKVALRLRLLRDGEVTAAPKTVRVYLDWDSVAKVEMVFHAEAGEGEWSRPFIVDLATLLAQGEWLFCGVDNTTPRRTRALYLSPTSSGDITFNITNAEGGGGDAGVPATVRARVAVDKLPVAREVLVVERELTGEWRVAGHMRTADGAVDLRVVGGDCYALATDDYGVRFEPSLAVTVGQRVRPTQYVGWLYEVTEAGTLPVVEPEWWPGVGDNAARPLGAARARAVRYYQPLAHGPFPVEII